MAEHKDEPTLTACETVIVSGVSADSMDQNKPGYCLEVGARRYSLRDGVTTIGREPEATIAIDSPTVSRNHASLTVDGDRVWIEDLGSKNGTSVHARRIDTKTEIADGFEIQIGRIWVTLRRQSED